MAVVQLCELDLKSPLLVSGQVNLKDEELGAQSSFPYSNGLQTHADNDGSTQSSSTKNIWKKFLNLTKNRSSSKKLFRISWILSS